MGMFHGKYCNTGDNLHEWWDMGNCITILTYRYMMIITWDIMRYFSSLPNQYMEDREFAISHQCIENIIATSRRHYGKFSAYDWRKYPKIANCKMVLGQIPLIPVRSIPWNPAEIQQNPVKSHEIQQCQRRNPAAAESQIFAKPVLARNSWAWARANWNSTRLCVFLEHHNN